MDTQSNNNPVGSLKIDLSGLEIEDVEVFAREGSRGLPDFAASCDGWLCQWVLCSCGCEAAF
ncbi:MAG TPA: hypothetical protein VFV34_15545 [Blastocatellia bacterium]|nr:hypothetical protein [Blastocatellia bacterium]